MKVVGSPNSIYFLFWEKDRIFLRAYDRIYWEKRIEGDYIVLGVGNNGDAFYMLNAEVCVAHFSSPAKVRKIDFIKEMFLEATRFKLKNFYLNGFGESIAFEREILKPALKKTETHEIIVYNVLTGEKKKIYECVLDSFRRESFIWNISRDFYSLVAIRGKEEKKKYLYDIFISKGLEGFKKCNYQLCDVKIENVFIHNSGIGGAIYSYDNKREMAVFVDSGKFFKLALGKGHEFLHLSQNNVVFWSNEEVIVKNFQGELLYRASFHGLSELGFNYRLLFNERDDLDLVLFKGGKIKFFLTELRNLPIESKRWKFLAENLEELVKGKKFISMPERKIDLKAHKEKSKEILKTVATFRKKRMRRKNKPEKCS